MIRPSVIRNPFSYSNTKARKFVWHPNRYTDLFMNAIMIYWKSDEKGKGGGGGCGEISRKFKIQNFLGSYSALRVHLHKSAALKNTVFCYFLPSDSCL